MGRILNEGIENQDNKRLEAFTSSGASSKTAWLYGSLSKQSLSYLAYAAYRSDVLLRETAIVGLVGGSGLGWQLTESLSSFNWAEVILIIICFICLTLSGEAISEYLRNHFSDRSLENYDI